MTIKTEAKLLRRATATLIDYGLYFIFFVWMLITYGVKDGEGSYSMEDDSKDWWFIIAWMVYFPICESITGRTLGKLLLGLRVVTKNGNPISFWQAFKRHLVDMLDFNFFGMVAVIAIKYTPDHQRLGDLWAKTIVIGGDTFYCSHCNEKLELAADEMMKREYSCPSCRKTNVI